MDGGSSIFLESYWTKRHIRSHNILYCKYNVESWNLFNNILNHLGMEMTFIPLRFICDTLINFIPFMKFGEREMQVTHFFGVSGSTWETIPVQDTIRVYSRQSTIIPAMIGHTCAVRHVVRLVSKKCQSFNAFAYDMTDMSLFFSPGPQRPRLRARGHQRGHGTSLEVISGHAMSFGRCGATPPCRRPQPMQAARWDFTWTIMNRALGYLVSLLYATCNGFSSQLTQN